MSSRLTCSIPLPAAYRPNDILAFHRRDSQALSERVRENSFEKGLLWDDLPACLSVHFRPDQAVAELSVDGEALPDSAGRLEAMATRMLGLNQGVEVFEHHYRNHPLLGNLLARQSGLRVAVTATPFEALTWAVTGQQISVSAAVSIRRKLIATTALRHSSGLLCYPGATQIADLSEEMLRQAGFSASKTRTLLTLAELVMTDQLPLDSWEATGPVEEIRTKLLAIRGIGPWTLNYTLLRGFGWLDGSLHGDVAVRRGLQLLLDRKEKIAEAEAQTWLAEFSPWRALVAAHLWAAKSILPY